MVRRAHAFVVAGVSAVTIAGATLAERARFEPERRAMCERVGTASLDRDGVRVFVESRLSKGGALEPGRIAGCAEDAHATALFEVVRTLAQRTGVDERGVVVHYAPRGAEAVGASARVETHAATGQLLVAAGELPDEGVLAHELVHVALARSPQRDDKASVATRLRAALAEGVADYGAAVTLGTSIVGDPTRGPSRDLSRSPPTTDESWANLVAPGARFDPHALGWAFAATLYARAPHDTSVRDDLYRCFESSPATELRSTLDRWLEACPARHRSLVGEALRDWAPRELFAGYTPPR